MNLFCYLACVSILMNIWDKFNETLFLGKEDFQNNLNLEFFCKKDCKYTNNILNTFKQRNQSGYDNLGIQSGASLMKVRFENFRDKFIKTFDLHPAHFYTSPEQVLALIIWY